MKTHELKILPDFFEPVLTGAKTFELRRDDGKGYRAGDVLWLREWRLCAGGAHRDEGYTGRETKKLVTYLLGGWGLESGYVCMSMGELPSNVEVMGASRLYGEASSGEAATSTAGLGDDDAK